MSEEPVAALQVRALARMRYYRSCQRRSIARNICG
jgi:hypothetical protein